MLCLYLDIPIIGLNLCRMLRILNEITLQQKLQHFRTINGFWAKKVNSQHNNKVKRFDCSQPLKMFQRNRSKYLQTMPNLRATLSFNKVGFPVIF